VETLFGSESGDQKRPRSWRFWLSVLSPFLILGMCGVSFMKAKRTVRRDLGCRSTGIPGEHSAFTF
jgi:hypothetical protein